MSEHETELRVWPRYKHESTLGYNTPYTTRRTFAPLERPLRRPRHRLPPTPGPPGLRSGTDHLAGHRQECPLGHCLDRIGPGTGAPLPPTHHPAWPYPIHPDDRCPHRRARPLADPPRPRANRGLPRALGACPETTTPPTSPASPHLRWSTPSSIPTRSNLPASRSTSAIASQTPVTWPLCLTS